MGNFHGISSSNPCFFPSQSYAIRMGTTLGSCSQSGCPHLHLSQGPVSGMTPFILIFCPWKKHMYTDTFLFFFHEHFCNMMSFSWFSKCTYWWQEFHIPFRQQSEPLDNRIMVVWLSADSPPQKGCHFLPSYALMLCKVCLGHGTVGSGGVGLITFLGTCIWFVLRSQNMLLRLQMLFTYANISFMVCSYFYLLSLHMPWVLCVAVRKYVATLADVVHVRKHKFHGMFIFLFAKLAHALGAMCCSQKICCYACRCCSRTQT